MYGKHFASMYEGSMVGAGAVVFAVWGYCIAKVDPDNHTILLNPSLLAPILGEPVEKIMEAITFLESPDPNSKNPSHEGRRLLKESGFLYFMVSHEDYRNMRTMDDVREYERLRKKKYRDKIKNVPDVPNCPRQNGTAVSVSDSDSSEEGKGEEIDAFSKFWSVYPKKVGKKDALKAWNASKTRPSIEEIVSKVQSHKQSRQWQKDEGNYIPNPATWIRQERWNDELVADITAPKDSVKPKSVFELEKSKEMIRNQIANLGNYPDKDALKKLHEQLAVINKQIRERNYE